MSDFQTHSKIYFILLPGFSPDHIPVLPLKESLERKGHTALASTFFDDHTFEYFSQLTMEKCHDHVSQLIRSAKQQNKLVIGVGVSLGGALLLEYAKTHNDLDGIVSIGTPFRLKYRPLMSFGELLLPIIYPFWKKFEKRREWRLLPIGAGPQVIRYLETDFLSGLEKISVPTLFIHSKKDLVTDYTALPEFSKKISSERKKIILSENGDHVIDHDPGMIAEHIINFFHLPR